VPLKQFTALTLFWALALPFLVLSGAANAGVIVSPVSATASNTFPSVYFQPVNLINHNGLVTDFFSGISDFDSYIAGDPQHLNYSKLSEWFTEEGQSGATLTFDMGSVMLLDRLALWNEVSWGVGEVAVALSSDGVAYDGAGSFSPTDWPSTFATSGADLFAFAATPARFVQLTLSGCPQQVDSLVAATGGCALGEVAFRQAAVPEPFTLALFGAGLAGTMAIRRHRSKRPR
jgi:hypothetical protein